MDENTKDLLIASLGLFGVLGGVALSAFAESGRESRARFTNLRMDVYGRFLGIVGSIEPVMEAASRPNATSRGGELAAMERARGDLHMEMGKVRVLGDKHVIEEAQAVLTHLEILIDVVRDPKEAKERGGYDWSLRTGFSIKRGQLQAAVTDAIGLGRLGIVGSLRRRIARLRGKRSQYDELKEIERDPFVRF